MMLELSSGLLAETANYPKYPPEFATHVGWLVYGLLALVGLLAWLRIDSVRRAVLALEDPRAFAVLRIGFAIMTFVCFVNLEPYWRLLWSDEGIFDLAYAQDRMGRAALRGWDPDEGFYDTWAILNFLWNKPSLFYFWGSPAFVVAHMWAFFFVLLLYGMGVWTRATGILAWFLMSGIYNRNALYWEGTDTVYRAFWFILLFARTGHAWSVDNWWRCLWLKKRGRLEDPDATPEENAGKAPIYRLVPVWPRYLFMLQLAALYLSTGAVKTGHVWAEGDALYYALNMDHFYRFEWHTQQVSAVFGTNVFRLMTWVTHWWERLFPFVLVGVSLKFTLRHRDEPWYRAQDVWWRKWGARATLVAIWALVWRINVIALPFCLEMVKDTPADPRAAMQKVHVAYGIVIPAVVVAWYALGRWPVTLFTGGRTLGPITRRVPWLRIPQIRLDQDGLRAVLLGRRVWLTLGFLFHGFLILFMNIGMFPFIMLMTYAGFVSGEEFRGMLRAIVGWASRRKLLSRLVPSGWERAFVPAQPSTRVPLRGRTVPMRIVAALGLLGLYLVYAKAETPEWMGTDLTWWGRGWLLSCLLVAVVFRFLPPRTLDLKRAEEPGPALAYGAPGRFLALAFVVYHAAAVGISLFPSYPLFSKWRSSVRSVLEATDWLKGTGTAQSWEMFAPNPPRSNTFMKTVVVEADGDRWDLRNNAFHYRPDPWIWNDRMRKMQRRMVAKGKWYLRYWAHFQCREWALERGEQPVRVDILRIVTRIPTPDMVAEKGPYHPRKLQPKESDVQTHKCTGEGELPLFMKERYGLPITEADLARAEREAEQYERKFQNRKDQWDKRKDWGRWWAAQEEEEERARERQMRAGTRSDRMQRAQDRLGEGETGAGGVDDEGADADREE
jgi:hypothetical protein